MGGARGQGHTVAVSRCHPGGGPPTVRDRRPAGESTPAPPTRSGTPWPPTSRRMAVWPCIASRLSNTTARGPRVCSAWPLAQTTSPRRCSTSGARRAIGPGCRARRPRGACMHVGVQSRDRTTCPAPGSPRCSSRRRTDAPGRGELRPRIAGATPHPRVAMADAPSAAQAVCTSRHVAMPQYWQREATQGSHFTQRGPRQAHPPAAPPTLVLLMTAGVGAGAGVSRARGPASACAAQTGVLTRAYRPSMWTSRSSLPQSRLLLKRAVVSLYGPVALAGTPVSNPRACAVAFLVALLVWLSRRIVTSQATTRGRPGQGPHGTTSQRLRHEETYRCRSSDSLRPHSGSIPRISFRSRTTLPQTHPRDPDGRRRAECPGKCAGPVCRDPGGPSA
jgi:hypothetical protein